MTFRIRARNRRGVIRTDFGARWGVPGRVFWHAESGRVLFEPEWPPAFYGPGFALLLRGKP